MKTIYIKNKPIEFYKECLKIENYKIKDYVELNSTSCDFTIETMPKVEEKTLVEQLVREQYSVSDEFGILRQKDEKPAEYKTYYNYVESCKTQAKEKLKEYEEWKNS